MASWDSAHTSRPRACSRRTAAYLGVQEGGAAVGGDHKVAAEAVEGALGVELLNGEQEGYALAARQLHRDGRVVDAVLLLEVHVAAAVHAELAADLCAPMRVRQAAIGS